MQKITETKKNHLKLDDAEETEDACKTEEHTGNNGSDKSFCACKRRKLTLLPAVL